MCQPSLQLVAFATQAHHHRAGKVGMRGVTGQSALQQLQARAFGVHAAAGAVGQSHHAVDVREFGQGRRVGVFGKMVGNGAGGGGRAVHARQNADVVARGHTAVRAHDALESGVAARCIGFHVGAKSVVAGKVAFLRAHVQVVHMHMLARANGLAGKTNDLVVTTHGLTGRQGPGGDFVARRDQAAHGNALDLAAAHELAAGNDHVVGGMKANEGLHGVFQN